MNELMSPPAMEDDIRGILASIAPLRVDASTLAANDDLYAAGLSSLSTVDLMLAIEDHFSIEFTSAWLNRRTFATVGALATAVRALREQGP